MRDGKLDGCRRWKWSDLEGDDYPNNWEMDIKLIEIRYRG